MTVPDTVILGSISALAGYFAWQNRQIVTSYFQHIPRQTEALENLARKFDEHDRLSAEAHKDNCSAMREVTRVLKSMQKAPSNGATKHIANRRKTE